MNGEAIAESEFQLRDLEPFVGKTVHLRYIEADSGEEVEKAGEVKNLRLDLGGPCVFFNPRGRGVPCLIEGADVLGFRPSEQATRLRLVTKRQVGLPRAATIRRHLADAHGWPLERVNGMGDDLALAEHAKIDHDPLGHVHQQADSPMRNIPDELRDRVAAAEGARKSA